MSECNSSCSEIILGSTCENQINYGETIDITFTYTDENGSPIDLTSAVPSIFSSTPDVIKNHASVTVSDAVNGKIRFLLLRDYAIDLRKGRGNRFRLQVIFGSESDDVTPDIWLQIT